MKFRLKNAGKKYSTASLCLFSPISGPSRVTGVSNEAWEHGLPKTRGQPENCHASTSLMQHSVKNPLLTGPLASTLGKEPCLSNEWKVVENQKLALQERLLKSLHRVAGAAVVPSNPGFKLKTLLTLPQRQYSVKISTKEMFIYLSMKPCRITCKHTQKSLWLLNVNANQGFANPPTVSVPAYVAEKLYK